MTTSNTITKNDLKAIVENICLATVAYGRGEVGEIKAYGGSTIPAGWLLCDGQAVSRTTYSELFSVIGTTYGSGDGSTTFNVPDLRGRFPIGSGTGTASDATERTLGQSGGSERVTLNIDQIPSHNHTQRAGGYTYTDSNGQGASASGGQPTWGGGYTGNSVLTLNTGGGQSHGNMPPYIAINYIIYAKNTITMANPSLDLFYPVGSYYETSDSTFDPNVQWGGTWSLETAGQVHVSAGTGYTIGATGGEATHLLTIDELPPHNHKVSSGWQSTSGQPDRITYGAVSGQYQNTGNGNISFIENTGGNVGHNNMQPYIVVNRWHRTA